MLLQRKALPIPAEVSTRYASRNQWQQTWVDNMGGSTQYVEGKLDDGTLIFRSSTFVFSKYTMAIWKLSFFNFKINRVRQLGEI